MLTPGVYFLSSSAQLTGTLELDAQGDSSALFVFQIGSNFTVAGYSNTLLSNNAQPCNIIWQVAGSATLETGALLGGDPLGPWFYYC